MTTKANRNADVLKKLQKMSGKTLTLGNLLWSIREGENLTLVEFSQLLGVSKQYLCDLEKGRRFTSPKAAAEYAIKLGYSKKQFVRLCLQDLLDREDIHLIVELKDKAA